MLLQKYFAKLETVPETISTDPETISGILSQKLWLSKHIIIDNSTVNFTKSSEENINFIDQLVNESCQFKQFHVMNFHVITLSTQIIHLIIIIAISSWKSFNTD